MKDSVKLTVSDLLRKRDFPTLLDSCETDRRFWHELRFRLYDLEEIHRWAAIETVARLMKHWWEQGQEEKVRVYMRTLFWTLNDESGGIGWSSAQTIAEMIAVNPVLVDPYARMMIAHCIDEPPLVKGCLWGIGRMGRLVRDEVKLFQRELLDVFRSEEAEILGLASWAFGEANFVAASPYIELLMSREHPVRIYIDGVFVEKSVGMWAEETLEKLQKGTTL